MKRILFTPLLVFAVAMSLFAQQVKNGSTVYVALGAAGTAQQVVNATSTGTTVNLLAKVTTGASGGALIATTSDTAIPVYIVTGGAGTSGNATVALDGQAACIMDATNASGFRGTYVYASTTTGGRCHASASTVPGSWQVGTLADDATTSGSTANVQVNGFFLNSSGGGTPALNTITSAVAANTPLANGNNPQIWNWAQSTNTQAAMTFGETSAATTGGAPSGNISPQSEVTVSTLAASTATPLSVSQGSITSTNAWPALQVATTWNNAGLTAKGIVFSTTNTASAAGSHLFDLYGGSGGITSEFFVDSSGAGQFASGVKAGASFSAISGTTNLTYQGGSDGLCNSGGACGTGTFRGANNTASTASSAGGPATLQGGNETGTGANALTGGTATVAGGSVTTGTGTGVSGGGVLIQAGQCAAVTSATTCPGTVKVNQVEFTTGTATANDLACVTAANTVASCSGTGTGNFVGVIDSTNSNNVLFTTLGAGGTHTFNATSAAFTNGHFVCQDPAAANKVVDGGVAPCGAGQGVGIYADTSQTTTTPLVMMRSMDGGSANEYNSVTPVTFNTSVAETNLQVTSSIPASEFIAGRTFTLKVQGQAINTGGVAVNYNIRVYMDSQNLGDTFTISVPATTTNNWSNELNLSVLTTGSGGTFQSYNLGLFGGSAAGNKNVNGTINTTTTHTFKATCQMGTSASTATCNGLIINLSKGSI